MKTNNIFASALLVLCASSFLFSPHNNVNTAATLHEPGDYMYRQRAYPSGSINHEAFKEAIAQAQAIRRSGNRATPIAWEFAGPTNFGGRITDIEMHASDQQTVYAGSASGGVFKSTDGGGSWVPVFDDAPSLSIGDLAIAPSDPNIIYVGTGESNCGGGSLTYEGLGVFKSTDAGTTWSAVGLADSRNTGKVAIHPGNPDIVYVAAMGDLFGNNSQRGIFKTTDGGQSWQNVLYVNDSTGGIDVVIHPLNPDTVYAATWKRIRRPNYKVYGGSGCGVYRSYDGGVSWTELTNGLPSPSSTQCGRIGIDIARSSPNILYAIYADSIGYFKGIYKTVNNGDSWTQTNDAALSSMYSSYGWWNGKINVDPSDPDIFFVGGLDLYRSTNGGASYSNVSGSMHVDQHGVYIHPANNNLVIAGNDGGIYISNNGGSSWNSVNELPNMQFYACTMDYTYPIRLYGGTQDNGTKRTLSGNINGYSSIFGGDGFQCIVDPTDNNYIYAESQYGYIGRSTNGGASFNIATIGISNGDRKNWNTPIRMHPLDPNTLFTGTHRLYKSTNRAQNWSAISGDLTNGSGGGNLVYGTITTISISAVDSLTIWVGTDDGNVQMSPDGGSSWNNVTGSLPKRWVTSVVADPYDAATAYVTISGYRFDEFLPHVFKTTDAGSSWTDISGNLPQAPANDIIPDPAVPSNLYVATDMGVYATFDDGTTWQLLADSMPTVVVTDLYFHDQDRTLLAATFGRSLYKVHIPLSVGNPEMTNVYCDGIKAWPNPFKEQLNIACNASKEDKASLRIYDMGGSLIYSAFNGTLAAGQHNFVWQPPHDLHRGVYLIKLKTRDGANIKKVSFIP